MQERTVLAAVRQAVNLDGRCRVVRNTVGYDAERKVHYGLGKGSADLVGIVCGSGRVFALECKTDAGRPSKDQRAWIDAVRRKGGFAAVARTVDEALAAVERACAGETS